jgi:diacylglycerol kinase family enzyme
VKRARVVLNPSSGRERGPEHLELLNTRLKERFDEVTIVMTTGDGDAEREDTRCDDRVLPRAARFLVGDAPFTGQE